jgi:hypothetical protein
LFSECVVVGDEALALQVIAMRGEMYIREQEERSKMEGYQLLKRKRGRKSYVNGDESTRALTERISTFLRMRSDVVKIRHGANRDELEWDRYLLNVEVKRLEGDLSQHRSEKRRLKEGGFKSYEIPADDAVEV